MLLTLLSFRWDSFRSLSLCSALLIWINFLIFFSYFLSSIDVVVVVVKFAIQQTKSPSASAGLDDSLPSPFNVTCLNISCLHRNELVSCHITWNLIKKASVFISSLCFELSLHFTSLQFREFVQAQPIVRKRKKQIQVLFFY